jgi:putative tricarboxylic transport membrane protein
MKDRDSLGCLILVLFAFLVCYLSVKLSLWGADGPGDGLFPFMSGLVLALCGLFIFVKGLLKTRTVKVQGEIDKGKLFVYIVALLTYAVVFRWLGFVLTTFCYVLFMLKGLEKGTWKASLFVSSLVTVALFAIFYVLLDVPLPFGILKPLFPFL